METNKSKIEYEILGYKVKLQENDEIDQVTPDEIVELVRIESSKIMNKVTGLGPGEVALLVALNLAKENLQKAKKYNENMETFKEKASKALSLIEEVSPSSI